jgi:hypothetical protein
VFISWHLRGLFILTSRACLWGRLRDVILNSHAIISVILVFAHRNFHCWKALLCNSVTRDHMRG